MTLVLSHDTAYYTTRRRVCLWVKRTEERCLLFVFFFLERKLKSDMRQAISEQLHAVAVRALMASNHATMFGCVYTICS